MRAQFKDELVIVIAETPEDRASLTEWRGKHKGHVFQLLEGTDEGCAFRDLGVQAEACREPINIVYTLRAKGENEYLRLISNAAKTPFVMRGRPYASVEGFWQGLKFPAEEDRVRVAQLSGTAALRAGGSASESQTFEFDGATHSFGGPEHHSLMREACWAKFTQHEKAQAALLRTGERPLTHRVRKDSKTIPGALMADIWMRIRSRLRRGSDGRILYFERDRDRYGFLSHFEPSPIELEGERWPTVEHYYQAQRSLDPAYRAAIRSSAGPEQAKQLARSWFKKNGGSPRADWAEVKLDCMRRADWAKFSQNPALAARLLATGDAELVEDSPFDSFWGTGRDGAGHNWAGKIIMEVREKLRESEDAD